MSVLTGYIIISEPDTLTGHECRECGFDAVVTFPLHLISERGVSEFGTYTACVRCTHMEKS